VNEKSALINSALSNDIWFELNSALF